jgi:methionyl-tRNA synthetase
MALDIELPKQVFGHPWLLIGEGKMSKSKGNVIYADDLVELFGVDAIRYFVLHEMPFASDGTLTYELIIERINSDLANILGNLVNRTISMTNKYFDGEVKAPTAPEPIDDELIKLALETPLKVEKKMDELKVSDSIGEIFTLLRRSNKYIDETQPWILGRDESKKERLGTVLYNLLESVRIAAVLLEPYLPETAEKILKQLNTNKRDWDSLLEFKGMVPGQKVGKPEILFARIDAAKKIEEINKFNETKYPKEPAKSEETKAENAKDEKYATIDDFEKLDMRVAEIIKVEKHPNADKLLVFQLKIGDETRQVVSGIAKWYKPEDLAGKKVVMVYNLEPVTLRGVESNGMILSAEKGKMLSVVSTLEDIPSGATIS